MSTALQPMYKWQDLPWKKIERTVFKLQKRIYRASQRGDIQAVHKLQRLLIKSWSARCLAIRRVTQNNRGKNTAGVDGIKSLTPQQRLDLVERLTLDTRAQPVRRVWIDKPGKTEKRPLGIPTLQDRAQQALVKLALEPEWEARFEAHSYGFRPGRSCHDAIEAIFKAIRHKAKFVLDADIAHCFDKIDHQALLAKLQTFPTLRRTIQAWLKAGVMDGQVLSFTPAGAPQGAVLSPLLANVALHGLETDITTAHPDTYIIRYADDLVAIHPDREVIQQVQETMADWLAGIGLALKPSKTRITHTLDLYEGNVGFDFLGFHIRQYRVGKTHSAKACGRYAQPLGFKTIIKPSKQAQLRHYQAIKAAIEAHQSSSQESLIGYLNPIVRGWTAYYSTVCSKQTFSKLGHLTFVKLRKWSRKRHPKQSWKVISRAYWRLERNCWDFGTANGLSLYRHNQTSIKRHIRVRGTKSPYDGDWVYWAKRNRTQPGLPKRIGTLLKRQSGRCATCGLYFKPDDRPEVDHIIPQSEGGPDRYDNWQLLHVHCHHRKTALENKIRRTGSADDNSQSTEERCEGKLSRTVLEQRRDGRPPRRL